MDHWVLYGWFRGSEEIMSASIFSPVLPVSVTDFAWAIGYSLQAQFSFHLDDMMSFPRRLTKREAFVWALPSGKERWWQQNDFCPIEVERKKLRTLQGQLPSTLLASLLCLCVCVYFSLVGEKKCQTACEITTSHHFPSSVNLTDWSMDTFWVRWYFVWVI